jgi:predicted alpha/beta superfamily hydrolase
VEGWKDRAAAKRESKIAGDYQVLPKVHSKFLEHDRDVIVWFPPGYAEHPTKRYPVLYMHDGRQVFDPATSTWGKDWQVDELAQDMILDGELEPFLVVAADCTDARFDEYSPSRKGDDYLRFLIEELKPMVDATWRTDPGRSAIAGSSMGGLISFYAAWKRPDVYFGAACLSPAFEERYGHECFRMVEAARGGLPDLKLFLSCGGAGELEARLLGGTLEDGRPAAERRLSGKKSQRAHRELGGTQRGSLGAHDAALAAVLVRASAAGRAGSRERPEEMSAAAGRAVREGR